MADSIFGITKNGLLQRYAAKGLHGYHARCFGVGTRAILFDPSVLSHA